MQPPKCIRQVQQLNGKVIALSRFIARAAEKCLPFFRILKGNKTFLWNEECDRALQQLKEYLSRPPLLSPQIDREILFVYLAASSLAVASVLIREPGGIQHSVYNVSHALTEVERRYLDAEKLALVVIITARRLRAYFMAYSIVIYINIPLKRSCVRANASLVHRANEVRCRLPAKEGNQRVGFGRLPRRSFFPQGRHDDSNRR